MDEETQRRVAFMLHKLGLLPRAKGRNQSLNGYTPFQGFGSHGRTSEPNMVRWAREQREQEALRERFPSAFPSSASAPTSAPSPRPTPLTGTPRTISKPMQDFLASQDPSTDWSKVRMRLGGNFPDSYASTNGNMISFSRPLEERLKTFFHEVGHIPDWQSGKLSIPKYVGEALLHSLAYGAEHAVKADMPPVSLKPEWKENPEEVNSIWHRMSYEKQAEERARKWRENYYRPKKR